MPVPYCCMLDNRSLGPVTDTEIKLTKKVLNAAAKATWSYKCSSELKRGQMESIRITAEYFNAAAKMSYVDPTTSVMMTIFVLLLAAIFAGVITGLTGKSVRAALLVGAFCYALEIFKVLQLD